MCLLAVNVSYDSQSCISDDMLTKKKKKALVVFFYQAVQLSNSALDTVRK